MKQTSPVTETALKGVRERMAKLHDGAATYEGGYAISTGALRDFIRDVDGVIAGLAQTPAVPSREALISVTASLAAAISLLERTPKAKMAAPSNTMFAQMLDDYRRSLEKGRAALSDTSTDRPTRQSELISAAVLALAPLAAIADLYDEREDDGFQIWKDCDQAEIRALTLGLCRQAKQLLLTGSSVSSPVRQNIVAIEPSPENIDPSPEPLD
jgi:hypothetical protein